MKKKTYPISSEQRIREVIATFELEGMPLSEQDIQELRDIESGKITGDELRQKMMEKYNNRGM